MPIHITKENNTSRTIDADGNVSPLLPSTITLNDETNTVVQNAVYTDGSIDWNLTTKLAVNRYESQYGQIKTSTYFYFVWGFGLG